MNKLEIIEEIKKATYKKYGREDGSLNFYKIKKDTGMQTNQINALFGDCLNPGINSFIELGRCVGVEISAATIKPCVVSCEGCKFVNQGFPLCKECTECQSFDGYTEG